MLVRLWPIGGIFGYIRVNYGWVGVREHERERERERYTQRERDTHTHTHTHTTADTLLWRPHKLW